MVTVNLEGTEVFEGLPRESLMAQGTRLMIRLFSCEWAMKIWLLPGYASLEVKECKETRVLEPKELEGDEGERFFKTEPKESRSLRRTIMKRLLGRLSSLSSRFYVRLHGLLVPPSAQAPSSP
jgi:hypothetical protein